MAQPSFPGRGAYSGRIPDRTIPASSQQPQFGQSAPGFSRQVQFPPQQQPAVYGAYSQYTTGAGLNAGRGQIPGIGAGIGVEKESNALNDLSEEQRDEINEAFTIFDLDKDGYLDLHEFRVGLRALGFVVENNELLQLMTVNGVPKPNAQRINDGARGQRPYHASQLLVSHLNFQKVAAQKMMDRDPRDEVERAFGLFDTDKKGYISIDDLRRVTRELGETSLEEQELQTMIDEFDYEGVGGVSKEAFFGICLQ